MPQKKAETMAVAHRLLCIHLGTPPDRFLWQWADKDRGFHRDGWMTPKEFAEKYVTIPLGDYVCVVHDPRETSPTGRTFTVEYLGNVVDAPPVTYLNIEVDLLKRLAMQTVMDGEPVWFGCDVDQMMANDQGVWDARLFDLESVYDTKFDLSKAERLSHHETFMTHAMLFTGVDVVDDAPRRWRVENSWGDKKADQGFHTMNDSWFAEYVFEIAVRRDRLPEDLQARLDDPPIVLPAWDPMGALAAGSGGGLKPVRQAGSRCRGPRGAKVSVSDRPDPALALRPKAGVRTAARRPCRVRPQPRWAARPRGDRLDLGAIRGRSPAG